MDVADEGKDANSFGRARGVVVDRITQWSGKGSDIFASTEKAFGYADEWDVGAWLYDADGLGADVRGNARVINAAREEKNIRQQIVNAFRGSAGVHAPAGEDVSGRKNEDFFRNRKAQEWWALRRRVYKTYRAVVHGDAYDPDDLISLDSAGLNEPNEGAPFGLLAKLLMELSQPTYVKNITGHIVVDKAPAGMAAAQAAVKSPNLADCVMMLFARAHRPAMVIDESIFEDA
jgi:hypothetical protein